MITIRFALTIDEVCEATHLGRAAVVEAIESGALPARTYEDQTLVLPEAVTSFGRTFKEIRPQHSSVVLNKRHTGRPPGSGSFEMVDRSLIEEMRRQIESGAAKSALDAAGKVVDRAKGAGTIESKLTRLAKRYRKCFPSERN